MCMWVFLCVFVLLCTKEGSQEGLSQGLSAIFMFSRIKGLGGLARPEEQMNLLVQLLTACSSLSHLWFYFKSHVRRAFKKTQQ